MHSFSYITHRICLCIDVDTLHINREYNLLICKNIVSPELEVFWRKQICKIALSIYANLVEITMVERGSEINIIVICQYLLSAARSFLILLAMLPIFCAVKRAFIR